MSVYWIWWIAAAVLAAAELVTGTFYLLTLGVAMAIGGIAAWFGAGLPMQFLFEGLRNINVRVVAVLDTSNLAVQTLFDPATFNCGGSQSAPTTFRVDEIEYSVSDQLAVQLLWDATADVTFAALAGRGELEFWEQGGLHNNSGAGKTGIINVLTTGWTAGTQVFTLEIALVKVPG